MLYTKQQTLMMVKGLDKLPRKGQKVLVCDSFGTIVVLWTDRTSPAKERLYNVGYYREDGSEPPLFQW